jgi:hypothetical protein
MEMRSRVLDRTAWLFTREHESIHIQLEPSGDGWLVVVLGPGEASRSLEFADAEALVAFHESFERDLLEAGYRLQAVAERRTGGDRRNERRGGSERRRPRST